jgi:prophage DNA circulation protein
MAWEDELFDAELAGVRVHVHESSRSMGRRNPVTHRPGSDVVHARDLGKRPRRWAPLECFVIGRDYHLDRQSLTQKLNETPGPHEYIDPWDGPFQVELDGGEFDVTDSTRHGGMATFRIPIVEQRPQEFPPLFFPSANVKTKVVIAKLSTQEASAKKFTLGKLKRLVTSALGTVTTGMKVANGKVNSLLGFPGDIANEIDAIEDQLAQLQNTPQALFNALQGIWNSIVDLIREHKPEFPQGTDDGLGPAANDDGLGGILIEILTDAAAIDVGQDDDLGDDEVAEETAETLDVIKAMALTMPLLSVCDVLSDLEPDDANVASDLQDSIGDSFSQVLAPDSLEDSTESLLDTQAATLDYLVEAALQAPRVVVERVENAVPSLVLAKILYGDARQENQLLRRKRPHNPLFMRGDIEVVRE